MAASPCWFCENAPSTRSVDGTLHDPKTGAREEIAAPACDRCCSIARYSGWAMLALFVLILLVVAVVGWIVADLVLPDKGPSGTRGKAMGLIFWPIVIVGFVLDIGFLLLFRRLLCAIFGMRHVDLGNHPRALELLKQGYKWGKGSAAAKK